MKRFRLTADAVFLAENIDDALRRLSEHFLAMIPQNVMDDLLLAADEEPVSGVARWEEPSFFLAESRIEIKPEGEEPP